MPALQRFSRDRRISKTQARTAKTLRALTIRRNSNQLSLRRATPIVGAGPMEESAREAAE